MIRFPHVLPIVKPLYSTANQHQRPPPQPALTADSSRRVFRRQRSLEVVRKNNTVAPVTRCHSEDATRTIKADIHPDVDYFSYNNKEQIVNTAKMYEPVADSCVTILTRFSDCGEYQQTSSVVHSDDESRTHREEKEIKNNDNKIRANVIPEKPPRRIKLQKLNQSCPRQSDNIAPPSPASPALCMATADSGKNCSNEHKADDTMRTKDEHKVDLEDINRLSVESERNYKNKFLSVGVQVSPLPPYRLRVLPQSMRKVKSDPEKCDCSKDRAALCCTATGRWMFSQCGLTVIIITWALLGAAAFHETEGPREREQAEELATLQYNLAVGLASELRQVVPHEPVWLSMVQNYFAKHETLLLDAVSSGYGEGGGGGHIWTYPGCLLFAVSLLTTLGFGAPVPRTTLGRGAAVLFSAIGIPLHFLLVLNIGVLIASKLQALALKRQNNSTNSPSTNSVTSNTYLTNQPRWLKWLPVASIAFYYILGTILFGFVRQRNFADSLLFPLDFTATGGVAKTLGHVRILYALYLEIAVTLAATMVSLLQVSASRGIINLGLRFGLLTNT